MEEGIVKCKICSLQLSSKDIFQHFLQCQKELKMRTTCEENRENIIRVSIQQKQEEQQQQQRTSNNQNKDEEMKKQMQIQPEQQVQQKQQPDANFMKNVEVLEILKKCIYCEKMCQESSIDAHYDECEARQSLEALVNFELNDLQMNNNNDEDMEEESLPGGVIKRTTISKDDVTGFIHYKTVYHYPKNSENQAGERRNQNQRRQSKLQQLVKFKFQPSSQLSPENLSCAICFEKYEINDKLIILPCMHKFHSKCLNVWFQEKEICPVCKFELEEQ